MLIFGLGNPGTEYENTRHNAGRIILFNIAKNNDFPEWKKDLKLNALKSVGKINNEKFELILPETFMNNSSQSVFPMIDTSPLPKASAEQRKKKIEKIIVIHDDIDLPLGTMKISFNKSSGGHRGVESIIKKLKSQEFIRIRLGISPTTPTGKTRKPTGEEKVLKFLLGKFKEDELKIIKKHSKKIAEALVMITAEGRQKAMSVFN